MKKFDDILCDFLKEQGVPGASLYISYHGKPIYKQGCLLFYLLSAFLKHKSILVQRMTKLALCITENTCISYFKTYFDVFAH
jgi:hypothetical protein